MNCLSGKATDFYSFRCNLPRRLNKILLFLSCLFTCTAFSQVKCVIQKSNNELFMQQVSDHVGFCAAFAFRALLHQARCQVAPDNCRMPSVLTVADMSRVQNVTPPEMVQYFNKHGIQDENCLKFTDLFPMQKQSTAKPLDWDEGYLQSVLPVIKEDLTCEQQSAIAIMTNTNKQTIREIYNAINTLVNKKIREKTMQAKCDRRPTPQFTIRSISNLNTETGQKELWSQLKNGHNVQINLFINQPGAKKSGPHSVVVTNFRRTCCNDLCTTQYQLLDSLGFYWAPSHSADGWVTEMDFLNALYEESTGTYLF